MAPSWPVATYMEVTKLAGFLGCLLSPDRDKHQETLQREPQKFLLTLHWGPWGPGRERHFNTIGFLFNPIHSIICFLKTLLLVITYIQQICIHLESTVQPALTKVYIRMTTTITKKQNISFTPKCSFSIGSHLLHSSPRQTMTRFHPLFSLLEIYTSEIKQHILTCLPSFAQRDRFKVPPNCFVHHKHVTMEY